MNGMKVSVATMALGSKCRNMMVSVPAQRAGLDIFEIAGTEKFCAHHADQRHPRKQEQNAEQNEKARLDNGGNDDQQIKRGHRCPISINRCRPRSTQPPKYPCTAPASTPY